MLRLFVALPLPDSVKRSLEPLTRGLGDVRWLGPDQQHLTLRFIGEVDNGRLDEIAEALTLVPGAPLEVRLDGPGSFPAARRAAGGLGRGGEEIPSSSA